MFRFAFLSLVLLVFLSLPASADPALHPSYGHASERYERVPGEKPLPASWTRGDLVFPGTLSDWDASSPAERYITSGAMTSNLPGGGAMMPWSIAMYVMAREYHQTFGEIPDVLDEDALRRIPRREQSESAFLNEFRNPITGNWPRLKAAEFSPGDLYIRPLTQDEREHYQQLNPIFRLYWSPQMLGDTDVYYMRIYGSSGILIANFLYPMGSA